MFQALERYEAMEAAFRKALALSPTLIPTLRSLRRALDDTPLMNALYQDDVTAAEIYAQHRAWGEKLTAECRAGSHRRRTALHQFARA